MTEYATIGGHRWEVWRPTRATGRSPGALPGVALLKSGVFSLNAAARACLGEGVTHVRLYFDPDTRRLGLKASQDGDSGLSLRLSSNIPGWKGAQVAGWGFCRAFGVPLPERSYVCPHVECADGMLIAGPLP